MQLKGIAYCGLNILSPTIAKMKKLITNKPDNINEKARKIKTFH